MIQALLVATMELRLLRLSGSQSMERIVTMDRELARSHKTEVVTDEATVVLRRAVKLAQGGLLVSVGPSLRHSTQAATAQVPGHAPPPSPWPRWRPPGTRPSC